MADEPRKTGHSKLVVRDGRVVRAPGIDFSGLPEISPEGRVAHWIAEIKAEDERARAAGEAHGNYGEEFGEAVFALRDSMNDALAWRVTAKAASALADEREAERDALQGQVAALRDALAQTVRIIEDMTGQPYGNLHENDFDVGALRRVLADTPAAIIATFVASIEAPLRARVAKLEAAGMALATCLRGGYYTMPDEPLLLTAWDAAVKPEQP